METHSLKTEQEGKQHRKRKKKRKKGWDEVGILSYFEVLKLAPLTDLLKSEPFGSRWIALRSVTTIFIYVGFYSWHVPGLGENNFYVM